MNSVTATTGGDKIGH